MGSDVAAHSIRRRTNTAVNIRYLKHRELRRDGYFSRPWLAEGETGNWRDLIDGKPFSTEFSHTRFLVPALNGYSGWALFFDADMIFLTDVKKLFALCDDRYAVMCVKHQHLPPANARKMDGREQTRYFRKNWSSFMLFNCGHPANAQLTPEKVNFAKGSDLHAFYWLKDHEIGALPYSYNYISGVSPKMPLSDVDVIHYTEGGPWFEECQHVPFGELWVEEHEHWSANGHDIISPVASTVHEK